ncbi:hypothetical protein [Clostridium tarantellae]|uniref:Uncharacterized protein n=1 Tax=Clostridium tarantellae TaxID=39493 RepID=A0A6I1MP52_9CLOT|nr:hypothetical protein [Clostridium tarantellae]MPQ44563.1 hypothetical protein [Clostridium tarantellae]
MNNINITYLDELDIPNIEDDSIIDLSELNTNVDGNPLNSNSSIDFNIINENNHISILNSSNFNVSFQIIYTLGEKNITLNLGEFLPLYTRQMSFEKKATFIYLIINSIDSSKNQSIIYHSNLNLNKNYKLTITGDLTNPIISEN